MNDLKLLYNKASIKDELADVAETLGMGGVNNIGDILKELATNSGGGALIVEGTIEDNLFTPNEGQPTHDDAVQAISEGRNVIIVIPDEEGNIYHNWITNNPLDGYMMFGENKTVW